jgi:hypothetical protein
MAILTKADVRAYARATSSNFAADEILINEHKRYSAGNKKFHVFLSHRYADKTELRGLVAMLEDLGISVFLDWREYPQFNRATATKAIAAAIKSDMRRCSVLLYAITSTVSSSIWMPWELGLFDGMKARVATVPLAAKPGEFPGLEYAALYPWVERTTVNGASILWVREAKYTYTTLPRWVQGHPCTRHDKLAP